jgi:uncharacterized protein
MPVAPPAARLLGVMRGPSRRTALVAVAVLAAAVLAVACTDGDPTTAPEGFDARIAVVTGADGPVEHCVWVADTDERRARGMMGATGFGAADAMAFVHDAPTSGRFWMKGTLIPLSIVFFDGSGTYLDGFDMQPCTAADPADCLRYDTPIAYRVAIETALGDAGRLGLVPGSSVEITDRVCGS